MPAAPAAAAGRVNFLASGPFLFRGLFRRAYSACSVTSSECRIQVARGFCSRRCRSRPTWQPNLKTLRPADHAPLAVPPGCPHRRVVSVDHAAGPAPRILQGPAGAAPMLCQWHSKVPPSAGSLRPKAPNIAQSCAPSASPRGSNGAHHALRVLRVPSLLKYKLLDTSSTEAATAQVHRDRARSGPGPSHPPPG
jgi:hypothetical protein